MVYMGDTSYLYGTNSTYLADLYEQYVKDKSQLSQEWVEFFSELDDSSLSALKDLRGSHDSRVIGVKNNTPLSDDLSFDTKKGDVVSTLVEVLKRIKSGSGLSSVETRQATLDTARAMLFIRGYRLFGHHMANLDPLGLTEMQHLEELNPETYGFDTKLDMDRPIFLNYAFGLESASLREIINICQRIYCRSVGVEYLHCASKLEKDWFRERLESDNSTEVLQLEEKKAVLTSLAHTDLFERFLDKKYRGIKRFGLDGGESLVPLLENVMMCCSNEGVESIVMGMAHRGRLNILCNVLKKSYTALLYEFMGGSSTPVDISQQEKISGDVKYHLGASADRNFHGSSLHVTLCPNPSHLEAVNTVVLGKVHARQMREKDKYGLKSMGILLHGDAAFIGQGIVAETFLLSQLDGYRTGGTIHIAINNQIGFTTKPSKSRSSRYCSDMAKMINAPILHVNGDDPEACIFVARLAVDYRMKFKKDIVIDMWCYRRHGHNEGDEPMFTQPKMYSVIENHHRVVDLYAKKLIDENVLEKENVEQIYQSVEKELADSFVAAKSYKPNKADWLEGAWQGLTVAPDKDEVRRAQTCIDQDIFHELATNLVKKPKNFTIHHKVTKRIDALKDAYKTGENIDWAAAEALAFGSLLLESTPIRLSGEDSQRGTFSQRHSVWIDQNTENEYIPLNNLRTGQAKFKVLDSPLSEFGLLGFEYGYAMENPHSLVLWEAQFGDFANGAQVIIDQFIASGETKWLRMNGLILLLPHGYEGQGPEHSSARLERYLQLSAQDNWQVCNLTTPANYFHVLRRQVKRNFRKPLVLLTPKSLLRHKSCVSSKKDFLAGTHFHRFYMDETENLGKSLPRKSIKRVILCSGKVYFDLTAYRHQHNIDDVHIVRLEQLYPFPHKGLLQNLTGYENSEFIWCQEEPENNGAWNFVDRKLERILQDLQGKNTRARYVGRKESASPATGSAKRHMVEQETLIKQAFDQAK